MKRAATQALNTPSRDEKNLRLHPAVLKGLSVEQRRKVVDKRMDEQGSAVLDQKDGSPANLGAY